MDASFLRLVLTSWFAVVLTATSFGEVTVQHQPAAPRSGQPVRIEIGAGLAAADEPVLEYQVVAPGKYIAKADPAFAQNWIQLALKPVGEGRFTADMPINLQRNRQLIRYRIRSANSGAVLLPPKEDKQGNYAYYVYDGVPVWRGAVNPQGDGPAREVRTFLSESLTRVPVYQLIASQESVETAMWRPGRASRRGEARREYFHTGTFVYDGVVHDHVQFRARGGSWRHAMGKNMWKLNFVPGHRLAARDDYGRPYAGKWDKLNLGACIQQADYGMRGEQGMFDALSYRLFNLAGVPAPRTHWIHFRVVSEAEESPTDQYHGDFWGLYLAVEEIDGDFLKEHDLPDGNVYKIDGFQPEPQHFAKNDPGDSRDAQSFLGAVMSGRRSASPVEAGAWWAKNVDLQSYYGYRAVLEAVHHYDVGGGKNYFFYHNLTTGRWQTVPWDVDLTWGDHMFGNGGEPFYEAGLLQRIPFEQAYQQRLAELRDLLLNPEQVNRLIDEHAAMIWSGKDTWSLADADRAKWDYHPIMSSRYVMSGKSDPGRFYLGRQGNRFGVMPKLMKVYFQRRQGYLDSLLQGYQPPAAPTVAGPREAVLSAGPLKLTAQTAGGAEKLQWRLAEVTDPTSLAFNPKQPWHYEIDALWQQEGGVKVEVPLQQLQRDHTYRLRARSQDATGRYSRWSAPVEFVAK